MIVTHSSLSVSIMTRSMSQAATAPPQVADNRDTDNNVAANDNVNGSVTDNNVAEHVAENNAANNHIRVQS